MILGLPRHLKIIDMSADFRLRDPQTYANWYGGQHKALDLQAEAVYGLTEHYRDLFGMHDSSPVRGVIPPLF